MIFDRHADARVFLRACVLVAFTAFLLVGCGRNTRPVVPPTYTVKSGDTLYSIAWCHDLDYQKLARWNNIPSDFRIHVGQVIRLYPPAGQRGPAARPRSGAAPRPAAKPKTSVPSLADIPVKDRVAAWVWPADASAAAVQKTDAPAILIAGNEGQQIRAAAAGNVVYTGSGIRGFGELIIIKHSEVFLTAYAHNRSVLVKEGDPVKAGQAIAQMGLGPKQQPVLYFEIRIQGQPTDPLQFLPRR